MEDIPEITFKDIERFNSEMEDLINKYSFIPYFWVSYSLLNNLSCLAISYACKSGNLTEVVKKDVYQRFKEVLDQAEKEITKLPDSAWER